MEKNNLKLFIAYLEENRNNSFSSSQWKQAVKDFSLDKDDLQNLKKRAYDHREHSQFFRERNQLEDAIDELERAHLFSEPNPDFFLQLGLLYRALYENQSFSSVDRLKALENFQKIAEIERYKRKIQIQIKELKQLKKILEPAPPRDKTLFIVLIPILLISLAMLVTRRDKIILFAKNWLESKSHTPSQEVAIPDSMNPYGSRKVDIYGIQDELYQLNVVNSQVSSFNGRDAYTLQAELKNLSGSLSSMDLLIQYLDSHEARLDEERLHFPQGNSPLPLPGETLAIDFFRYITLAPEEIDHLSISVEKGKLMGNIPMADKELWISWAQPKPEGISFRAEMMETDFIEGYDRLYILPRFVLENRGNKRINSLLIQLELYGKEKQEPFKIFEMDCVQADSLPLKPGQKKSFQPAIDINHQDNRSLDEITIKVINLQ